jgi:regulator of protease activity HflC (stomatin/prohibitin superfamily)
MGVLLGTVGSFFIVILLCLGLYGCPQYNVYSSRMDGEAELAKAEYSKRVMVQTSQAKLDAASLEAQSDVVRAEGVAKANKILADGLGGPEGYLRWKYIQMLEDTSNSSSKTVIYVPTEATMPILEAGKR